MPKSNRFRSEELKNNKMVELPRGWEMQMAADFCSKVTDGTHDTPEKKNNGKYLITSRHLKGNKLDFDNAYFISEEDFNEINKRSEVDQWDVIFSMIGTVGETYIEKKSNIDYAIKNVGLFKCENNELKGKWLFYYLKSRMARDYIRISTAGTTQEYMTLESLRHFPISYPKTESEMRKIVEVIDCLQNKIELSHQMNTTLERIGQAIFKHWFIDFEFPNEKGKPYKSSGGKMVDSELGEIPEGWKAGCIGEVGDNHREALAPSSVGGRTLYIGLEHMPRKCITLEEWGCAEDVVSNKYVFNKGDILFGKLRPYFHKVGVAPADGVCSTDILVIVPKKSEWHGFLLFHVSSEEFINYTDSNSTGTKMPRTNWHDMSRYRIVLPREDLAKEFNKTVNKLLQHIQLNIVQSHTLRTIRDSLLPRLMSGKIRVNAHGSGGCC